MNKSRKTILRILSGSNAKFKFFIFIMVFFSMFLFSIYASLKYTDEKNKVMEARETYGNYHFNISFDTKEHLEQYICDNNNIKSVVWEITRFFQVDEIEAYVSYISEDELYNTDFRMVEGKYPEGKDEVAVERWYMLKNGYRSDEIIGSYIEMNDASANEVVVKRVTGIVERKLYDESVPIDLKCTYMLANPESETFGEDATYSALVLCKDASLMEREIPALEERYCDEYGNSTVNITENYELLFYEGYTDEAKWSNRRSEIIYFFILFILLVFVAFTLNNALDISKAGWSDSIRVLKLMGANMNVVIFCITKLVFMITLAALVSGALSGVGVLYLANKMSLKILVPEIDAELAVSPIIYIVAAVILVLSVVITIYKFYIITECTPQQVVDMEKRGYLEDVKVKKYIFVGKKFNCLKFAIRNVFYYGWRKVFIVFSIIMSVVTVVVMCIQVNAIAVYEDNNDSFEYKVMPLRYPGYDSEEEKKMEDFTKQIYAQMEELCQEYGEVVGYYADYFIKSFWYDKSKLSKNHLVKIKNDVITNNKLNNREDSIALELVVMGYSDDMIDEMCKLNGMETITLGENEGIMLDRTVNRNNSISYLINPLVGEKCKVSGFRYSEKSYNIDIVSSVHNLLVYPEQTGNYMCLIVNMDTFKRMYGYEEIFNFYIKSPDEELVERMEELCAGTNCIYIKNQKDDYEKERNKYYQSLVVYMGMFIVTILCVFVNLVMVTKFEFVVRKDEYRLLDLLGIGVGKQSLLCLLESILVYVVGILGGVAVSRVVWEVFIRNGLIENRSIGMELALICGTLFLVMMGISAAQGFTNKGTRE